MKKIITMFSMILLISASQAIASPPLKIGTVDLQRAVKECKEGGAARTELQKKAEKFNAELKVLQVDYKRMNDELVKDGSKLSADRRIEKEEALQKKGREFKARQRDAEEEVKEMESDDLKKLVNRLSVIMAKIGDEGKFTAILDRNNGVFYAGKEIDITSLLIKRADEEYAMQQAKNEER
jgi:outer membrane protein